MGSASEGEVLRAVAATEVKSIWHIENTWVSVCSAKEWNDELTLLDTDTIDLNRPCREAPRELIGGVVTNHFISHIVGASGVRQEAFNLARIGCKRQNTAAERARSSRGK